MEHELIRLIKNALKDFPEGQSFAFSCNLKKKGDEIVIEFPQLEIEK